MSSKPNRIVGQKGTEANLKQFPTVKAGTMRETAYVLIKFYFTLHLHRINSLAHNDKNK